MAGEQRWTRYQVTRGSSRMRATMAVAPKHETCLFVGTRKDNCVGVTDRQQRRLRRRDE